MASPLHKALSGEALTYIIHHIFLPPKLPQSDDFDIAHETALVETIIRSLTTFGNHVPSERNGIDCMVDLLRNTTKVHDSVAGHVSENELLKLLQGLPKKGGSIALHVRAQNAGVLISKTSDAILFETFELSPLNQSVVATEGRLRRSFPGTAVAISVAIFEQADFQSTVAHTLARMSSQSAPGTQPQVKKSGRYVDECRDTTHPKMVSELFAGFLMAAGQAVTCPVIWKNTREEVLWSDAYAPWRRSPHWLLLRVSLQLITSRRRAKSSGSQDLYKLFLISFMSDILAHAHARAVDSGVLYALNAKIAQRLRKLELTEDNEIYAHLQGTMMQASRVLEARWHTIRQNNKREVPLFELSSLDLKHDSTVALPELDRHVNALRTRQHCEEAVAFEPPSGPVKHLPHNLPALSLHRAKDEDTVRRLQAFEDWVEANLDTWMHNHLLHDNTCSLLGKLIEDYHTLATNCYSRNPEATSIMLLTILELWIASDKSATAISPLLCEYVPGIPSELFQNLLLPYKTQMERLQKAEAYLSRRSKAPLDSSYLFLKLENRSSFGVKYFTDEHRALHESIKTRAHALKQARLSELRQKEAEHAHLISLHEQSECEYYSVLIDSENDEYRDQHNPSCKHCRYSSQARSLSITVEEWPLPQDHTKAQSVVFELLVPAFFASWRKTLVHFLLDVLKGEYSSMAPVVYHSPLSRDVHLSRSFIASGTSSPRLGLLTEVKPHSRTHRSSLSVSTATAEDVCPPNGSRYRTYDDVVGRFVQEVVSTDEVPKMCTYQLPQRSKSLQRFLFRPAASPDGPPPNEVIASQSGCPPHMALDEYEKLCSLPLGHGIQWMNMLLQLEAPSIDFKKAETSLFMLQCLYQAGPGSTADIVLRENHLQAGEETFQRVLLRSLSVALSRYRENWETSQALCTLISIARRCLSLCETDMVRQECIEFLVTARRVAFNWVEGLREKACKSQSQAERSDYLARAVEAALICADTFNVDQESIPYILDGHDQTSLLFQCVMLINDGKHTISEASGPIFRLLHARLVRLLFRCCSVLSYKTAALNDAILKSWPAYQPGTAWRVLPHDRDNWLVTETGSVNDSRPLQVHFDIHTGELLVNGVPLNRLPNRYEQHQSYALLFGGSSVEVMPTDVPGMEFSGKRKWAGFTVHFGMTSKDLLVQAVKEGRQYEFVPARLFEGHFPEAFVNKYIHWYNYAEQTVEFRPIDQPWNNLSTEQWTLTMSKQNSSWRMFKNGKTLLGVKSKTHETMSRVFSPIVSCARLHVVVLPSSASAEIDIPGIRLGFNFDAGIPVLRSKEFRGMSVDRDQSLETLVGFSNKIVLKDDRYGNRLLLLLEGPMTYQSHNGHLKATVQRDLSSKAHALRVDYRLGRLVDTGSLHSKLFLAHLHAITSFCLPDPLTAMTGTEQALSILDSAAVRSHACLSLDEVKLLSLIARLSPTRTYYPAHERVMQTVKWSSSLGFLSQHARFYTSVASILDDIQRSSILYPEHSTDASKVLPETKVALLRRDNIRSSTYRISGFGAADFTTHHDATYAARDRNARSTMFERAFVVSSHSFQSRSTLQWSLPSALQNHLRAYLSTAIVLGSNSSLSSIQFKYDSQLLQATQSDIQKNWITLHRALNDRQDFRADQFSLVIWFSTLSAAQDVDMTVLQTLAMFSTSPMLNYNNMPLPLTIARFGLSRGDKPNHGVLSEAIRPHLKSIEASPEANIAREPYETKANFNRRRKSTFNINREAAIKTFVDRLVAQWPCEQPVMPNLYATVDLASYIKVQEALLATAPSFQEWANNSSFYRYLQCIANALKMAKVDPIGLPEPQPTRAEPKPEKRSRYISTLDLFSGAAPNLPPAPIEHPIAASDAKSDNSTSSPELSALLKRLASSQRISSHESDYVEGLRKSAESLAEKSEAHMVTDISAENLQSYLRQCQKYVKHTFELLRQAVASNAQVQIASQIGKWPRVSPIFFLRQLTSKRWAVLHEDWKRCIVDFGLALTAVQRAERIVKAYDSGSLDDLTKELQNRGHTNWRPHDYPEWLLLEVESGLMIREVQKQIAHEMIFPPSSDKNAVMQLNMGEGKSSVIVPICASALSDCKTLVRIIVAKPQAKQMAQMLMSKLGGLLARRVYHLPFSRSLRLSESMADTLGEMCRQCMTTGGVLLIQPEHILSFKLMGLECYISGEQAVGRSLIQTQDFFERYSRDIVDESDDIFSVKFELIYTMGTQRAIDMSPDRWACIHKILELVRNLTPKIASELPDAMEVQAGELGAFPRTRILESVAQEHLVTHIATYVCNIGLSGFPAARQSESLRQAIFIYLTKPDLTARDIERVETSIIWTPSIMPMLFLLRGLLAGGILGFALGQKRWRVNYGLTESRQPPTRLAVPFKAKDSPSPRSEFSHPDVVIVLTSLSYYYGGLKDSDIFDMLGRILKNDQMQEFEAIVQDAPSLPPSFRELSSINLRDYAGLASHVFPHLRYAKAAIDYFLSYIVFPAEMKEFPHKISASGWDIGKIKTLPTTGFSGTKDSQTVLPLSVEQLDLPQQKHTDALVLGHLLKPTNSVALVPSSADEAISDAKRLLQLVMKLEPRPRVILDVGAQILELSNKEVAQEWLAMQDDDVVQAAVYVDDDDNLMVVTRHEGVVERLLTSSFSSRLGECLIYLDEAHTRGIDLRLPQDYRAAVTLGAKLTKDRMIQACMRMRRLATGQSVVFCVPDEIRAKIVECTPKPAGSDVSIQDILIWTISESWDDTRRSMLLWAMQGHRFVWQQALWAECQQNDSTKMSTSHGQRFLEDEAQTLEDRYRPQSEVHAQLPPQLKDAKNNPMMAQIAEHCRKFEGLDHQATSMHEEQERELSPELEIERQDEKPPRAVPSNHKLHNDVIQFAVTGRLVQGSKAYLPAFQSLRKTTAADGFDLSQMLRGHDLMISVDCAHTIKQRDGDGAMDFFVRPVQWILTNRSSIAMVVSPFEAQHLIPYLTNPQGASLHLYAPRRQKRFRDLDKLDLFSIPAQPTSPSQGEFPRSLAMQLNIFAGQAYFESFEDYLKVCDYLGLASEMAKEGFTVAADGFIVKDHLGRVGAGTGIKVSPIKFLKTLMAKIRRNGEGIGKTHMGKLLDSVLLEQSDFKSEEDELNDVMGAMGMDG